jgi:DNA-binding LacI/PurR family transcriptional regulator
VTIKDVSRHAGVSPTTVSHALNGRGRVGPETRDRILRVAEDLGYVANPIARALKSGRTMTIAAELPATAEAEGLESAFLRDVLLGAAEAAMETGYLLAITGPTSAARGSLPPLDGALVVDPVEGDPLIEHAQRHGAAIVTVSRFIDQPEGIPSVGSDYVAGTKAILDQLADAGYERPALLSTRRAFAFAAACLEGYTAWVKGHGVRPVVRYARGHPTIESGHAATRALLDGETPPDAIVAITEPLAVGALRALTEAGVAIPDDVGLASVSDSERLRSARVPVTALDLFAADIGRRAVRLLADLIESTGATAPAPIELPTRLHARASTSRGLTRARAPRRGSA